MMVVMLCWWCWCWWWWWCREGGQWAGGEADGAPGLSPELCCLDQAGIQANDTNCCFIIRVLCNFFCSMFTQSPQEIFFRNIIFLILYFPHALEPPLGNRGDLSIKRWKDFSNSSVTEKKSIHPWGGRPQDGEGVPANMLQLSHTPNPVLNGTNVNFLFPDQTIWELTWKGHKAANTL